MNFIDGTEPGSQGVLQLAQRALELKAGATPRQFTHRRLAALFFNPSLRTRTSLEFAAGALGVQPVILEPGRGMWGLEWQPGAVMSEGPAEHVADAAAVLSEMADVIAVRAFAGLVDADLDRADPVVSSFVAHATRPVINLESARWHPLQGLADTATWLAHLGPELQGRRLTVRWAPHPRALPAAVPQQALLSAALMGMDITVAHPEGFDLDPQVVARATQLATGQGGGVTICHDPKATTDAEIVIAKSWSGFSGYGQREQEAARRADLSHWRVDTDDLSPEAGFMHCLPIRRNVVATDAVLDSSQSWIHETGGLRMWTAMALLEAQLCQESAAWNA